MRHEICPCCRQDIREGDEIIVAIAGIMVMDQEAGQLFCLQEELPNGALLEYVYHQDCFEKGPEHEEPDLMYCGQTLAAHNHPRCSICDTGLQEGESVVMFRVGSVFRMDLKERYFYLLNDDGYSFKVYALYSHSHCVASAVFFPQIEEDTIDDQSQILEESIFRGGNIPY